MSADDRYIENKVWGERKEREAATILQQVYPEILIRQTDITAQVVPQEDIRLLPAQPNLQILLRGTSKPPVTAWCETARKTYEDFLAYRHALFVKLKTLNAMQQDHYLVKPLVRRVDDMITDIVAIRRPDMEKTSSMPQSSIYRADGQPQIGSGWTATVRVNSHSNLLRSGRKASKTFLEALLATTQNPKPAPSGIQDDIFG